MALCWWTRATPRSPRRSGSACGPPGRPTTWSSWVPGPPAWPPRCTRPRKDWPSCCWSWKRSAARPGRAPGSGTTSDSRAASAERTWPGGPMSRHGTFGTHFIYGNPATSLAAGEDLHVVGLADGSQVRSRAVILATGVSYRRLGIAELESLAGAGVFYGASTIEAQAAAGKPVFVVGGGNSAGQAALHLAKYAEQVKLLVRSQSLAASMSEYLTREIDNAANVHVRYRSEVAGAGGDGRL